MIYIILCIVLSTLIVVVFKLFTHFGINNLQAIIVNYFVASALGLALEGNYEKLSTLHNSPWLGMAFLSGFFLMFVFNVFALSSQKVGIAITAVSSKMSVVIPVTIGFILYKEDYSVVRIAAIALALLAFYLTFRTKESRSIKKVYLFLPVLLFFGNGTNDSLLNYAEKRLLNNDTIFFLSVAFGISLIFGILTWGAMRFKKPDPIKIKNIAAGIILGLLNFGSTYYFLVCLGMYESSFFLPLFNVSIVVSAALIGYFIFKEPLNKTNIIGIALAVAAILMISLSI